MNDEDLRDLFAGLASIGCIIRMKSFPFDVIAQRSYDFADAMIEAKYAEEEPDVGITAIKRKYVKKEK
jgi:hypothetical protein